jgi:hypothetical protein
VPWPSGADHSLARRSDIQATVLYIVHKQENAEMAARRIRIWMPLGEKLCSPDSRENLEANAWIGLAYLADWVVRSVAKQNKTAAARSVQIH